MQRILFAAILLFAPAAIRSEQLLSKMKRTSWTYEMVQETGEGVTFSDLRRTADGRVHLPVIYQLAKLKKSASKSCGNLGTHRAGVASDIGCSQIDDQAITCDARTSTTLFPPNKDWSVGKYRAEFYVHDELSETVKFTIANNSVLN